MTEAANSRKYLKRIAWGLALVAAVAIAAFAWERASAPAVASVVEYAMLEPILSVPWGKARHWASDAA